jgi:hypothetical protein
MQTLFEDGLCDARRRRDDWPQLVQNPESSYISRVAAILLSQAAIEFDPGSGTPKPHTSTAHHLQVALFGGLTFS